MIAEPTFIASLNGLCGFILVVQSLQSSSGTWRSGRNGASSGLIVLA